MLVEHTLSRDDFRDYADFCFKEFGDKVKRWFTLSEPYEYSTRDYVVGLSLPGQHLNCSAQGNSATDPYLVTHHQILAHAAAVDLYRLKYQVFTSFPTFYTLVN